AAAADGSFLVVWSSGGQDGSGIGIYGRRFAATGEPLDTEEFRVNTSTTGTQGLASVSADPAGNAVVVWSNTDAPDGSGFAVLGQRFDAAGVAVGPEFRVNSTTPNLRYGPSVASGEDGTFVVVWTAVGQEGDY